MQRLSRFPLWSAYLSSKSSLRPARTHTRCHVQVQLISTVSGSLRLYPTRRCSPLIIQNSTMCLVFMTIIFAPQLIERSVYVVKWWTLGFFFNGQLTLHTPQLCRFWYLRMIKLSPRRGAITCAFRGICHRCWSLRRSLCWGGVMVG